MITRRTFVQTVPLAACGALVAHRVQAQPALVDEKSAQAVALGYVTDTSRVDKVKYKQYQPGQVCANCSLYQGKADDPAAPCPLFPNQRVAAKAWCSAWVKKA